MKKPNYKTRRWLYRIGAAALVLLVAYKVLDGEQSAAWLLLIGALLGMADANASDQ